MSDPLLIAVVMCAIFGHGHHIPIENRDAIARQEAEAFVANAQPHISLSLLMGVAWVESRFSPTGSAADLRSRHYGVMQIFCDHDCDSYLDPATNIRRGASLLALRYRQVHAVRQRARVLAAWTGAYWWGSVPATRRHRIVRKWYKYAAAVRRAEWMMRERMNQCRRSMPELVE